MSEQRTILVLDDDPLHRQYMKGLIDEFVGTPVNLLEAGSGNQALEVLETADPDLCIFDLHVPDKSGIDVAKIAWEKNQNLRILFWSQHSDELYVRKLFSIVPEEAVYGFLIKTALEDQITSAIQYLLEYDQCWIDPKIRKVKSATFDKTTGLTDVEYETLVDIALGLADNTIAQRRFITRRGVQNRLSSLYHKLGVSEEQETTKSKAGYVFSPRARAVTLSLCRGLLNQETIKTENEYLASWLKKLR